MTVQKAMISPPFNVTPEQSVADVIAMFSEKQVRAFPVVDENNILLGIITLRILLRNVLPISAVMEHGIDNLDFLADTTAGAAKKLKKILDHPISDYMDENCARVDLNTSKWEAIRLMVKSNTILPVVDKKTNIVHGVMTAQSTLRQLKIVMEELEAEKAANAENSSDA